MILPDWRIRQLSFTDTMLYPIVNDRLTPVEYDLTVSAVGETPPEDFADITLYPGDSVLVHCVEDINLPPDIVAFVVARNSAIRNGLQVFSPAYQPGHKANIKFRVSNIGCDGVTINKDTPLAMIMFAMLTDRPNTLYEGRYQNEK